ncbi:class I SAM-dependent methyltransferase [Candidatus Pacearchaeota archaeon]|nr:class I SAM-dependent methyltransferase [Candidatus Pacearchaeota archaeon]
MDKNKIKKLIPKIFIEIYRNLNIKRIRKQNSKKSVKQVFQETYLKNKWGGESGEFYSGPGSNETVSKEYIDVIKNYIKKLKLKIIDLGCGDFRVSKNLISENVDYIGVDIVPELIQRNNLKFSAKNVKFECLDIIKDELPEGDMCIVRQVLQHLSNNQIQKVIKKLSKYKYVFIVEHYPFNEENSLPNKDKPHGQDTRLTDNSAVYLDKFPFNIKNIEEILVTKISKEEGKIKTFIIRN